MHPFVHVSLRGNAHSCSSRASWLKVRVSWLWTNSREGLQMSRCWVCCLLWMLLSRVAGCCFSGAGCSLIQVQTLWWRPPPWSVLQQNTTPLTTPGVMVYHWKLAVISSLRLLNDRSWFYRRDLFFKMCTAFYLWVSTWCQTQLWHYTPLCLWVFKMSESIYFSNQSVAT